MKNDKNENKALSQTSVMVSAVTINDFLNSKNIQYPEIIVDSKYQTHTLTGLMHEWACIYADKYLNYATIIEMIDESDDLKEFEIRINGFFKR